MRIALDTNILIRFLTHDDGTQYRQAYAVFQHPQLYIATTVFLETEWVLRYAYEYGSPEIVRAFRMLMGLPNIEAEEPGKLAKALTWHQEGMDFADALHLAGSQHCDIFYTFDQKFARKGKNVSACEVKNPASPS